jgi:PAS domain S-box-containing protein
MQQFFIAIKIVAILAYLVLVISVIQSKAERSVRALFVIYVSGMLFWQFGSLWVSLAVTAKGALLWYNLMVAGTGTVNVLFYPFAKAFTKSPRGRALTIAAYACCALMFAAGILGLTWREVVIGRGGYWVPVYNSSWLLIIGPIWYFFYGCGIVVLLRSYFREKSPVQRNRILYVLVGAAFVVVGISTNLTALRDFPVDITFNLLSALTIGIAVIRYKLLDIRLVLVRSLFYSVMTALLIVAYIGLILGLETVLQQGVGYSSSTYGILAVLVLAIVFLPIRNLLQTLIDKVFFREKRDYQRETQLFSRKISELYEEKAILDLVCETISKTVKTSMIALCLYDPGRERYAARAVRGEDADIAADIFETARSPLAQWLRKEGKPIVREETLLDPDTRHFVNESSSVFAAKTADLVVPVLLNERLLGLLVLGRKLSGMMYNGEDLSFLSTIGNQTATALEKSEIFLKMRRRLSEQTLLFILSEKFRGTSRFESVMDSIVQVLKNFLSCEHCSLVYFDKARQAWSYSQDRLSGIAADLAAKACCELIGNSFCGKFDEPELLRRICDLAGRRADLSPGDVEVLKSLSYRPLSDEHSLLGLMVISRRMGGSTGYEDENELLRTIQAIVSQGIALNRTIVDLLTLESYNEKILGSLNDMGDTLIILDQGGRITRVNKATCVVLDYSEAELVGRSIYDFLDDDGGFLSPEGLLDILGNRPVSNRELSYRARSGASIPMLFSGSAMAGEDGQNREVIGIARDMTERRKAEAATKNLLLLKEIHHRIKNNLQVISSLLVLQASYVKDEAVKEMFRESQFRIRSMALIHEKLYRSQAPSEIDFSEYIGDLASNLMISYNPHRSKIELAVEVTDVVLGIDSAVPCGLIINELVSNAFKHAFPGERSGHVVVRMWPCDPPPEPGSAGERAAASKEQRYFELRVEDDGVGFPEGMDLATNNSLGLKIVTTLTKQLQGTIKISRDGGTRVAILFKEQR